MRSRLEPREPPPAGPDLPGLLVHPDWLEERLGGRGLRTVDLRDAEAYRSGRVPGAVHLDLAELGTSVAGCDNVLVPPDEFGGLMAERGVSNGDVVVAYDDQWGLAAARLVWALHYYGHAQAAVLNGGWDRWQDEDRPSASGEEPMSRGRFEATIRADVHADRGWIIERIGAGDVVLFDARTPSEFEQGHLPGAICWDWFNAVPTGSWDASRDPEALRVEWGALGLDPAGEIAVYCRSGMRAAHTWLVMRNAGLARVRLYDGSWQEWSMTMEEDDGH